MRRLGRFNTWIYQLLASMQGGSRVVMAAVLGALMAVDFGGPINKAAYLFGTVALAGGQEEFMAAVMAGGMVPPLGVALGGNPVPGSFYHQRTPHRDDGLPDGGLLYHRGGRPLCAAGSAACHSLLHGGCIPGGGAVHAVWLCRTAPHGGMFLLPLNPHPFRYLLALLMGSLLTAVTLAVLRRKYPPKDEEQPTN